MGYKKWTRSGEQLQPDLRFDSILASKFINCMMWEGKKSVAQAIFYALDQIAKRWATRRRSRCSPWP